jgi:hypothetical protein
VGRNIFLERAEYLIRQTKNKITRIKAEERERKLGADGTFKDEKSRREEKDLATPRHPCTDGGNATTNA